MSTSKGRKPVSERKVGPSFEGITFGASQLDLPPGLKNQLENLGFSCRFINAKQLSDAGGYHRNGWKPFRRKDFQENGKDVVQLDASIWGNSPDGVVQRKEMILAIRPVEMTEAHRRHIQAKTDRLAGNATKQAAESLKRTAKENRVDVQVHEGYEDNDI